MRAERRDTAETGTRFKIPRILLEDDRPTAPPSPSAGRKSEGGFGGSASSPEALRDLPEAYGTQRLLLAARDPHWLYAHWDLTREQQRHYNSLSADRHLILRIREDAADARLVSDTHLHPESRHWFVHVARAGAKYIAELGFYGTGGSWNTIAASGPAVTPPDQVSADARAEFVAIPPDLPLSDLASIARAAARGELPLAAALEELRAQGHPRLPASATVPPPAQWTPEQERALAEVVNMDQVRRVRISSLEISELARSQLERDAATQAAAAQAAAPPTSPIEAPGGVSSPPGGQQPARSFRLEVNAELIVYGATEPGATVIVGGRPIQLRPDGSFSCRFALPDGQYNLPVAAVSVDRLEIRGAELKFSRSTHYEGAVGAHPQDPDLKPPLPGNV